MIFTRKISNKVKTSSYDPTPDFLDGKINTNSFEVSAEKLRLAGKYWTAGTTSLYAANTSRTMAATYTKYKEIIAPEAGLYRIYFSLNVYGGSGLGTVYGKIYKNGVAIGTERTVVNEIGTFEFTEDFEFAKLDAIQMYGKFIGTATGGYVSLFSIRNAQALLTAGVTLD